MIVGEYHRTQAAITDCMNKLLPKRTAIAISIPSRSPPFEAEKDANTSGAPPPKANNVTPAKDSLSLNVFEIYWREGDRNSSAVKLSRQKATISAKICKKFTY